MPKKGYKQTKSHRLAISIGHSLSKKNKGKNHKNFGKHLPLNQRRNIGKSLEGITRSEITRKRMSESQKKIQSTPEVVARKRALKQSPEFCQKMKERTGDKNPAWKGGVSFGKYCPKFNRDLRERVREFFGRHCLWCNKKEEDDVLRNGKVIKMTVHHVTFDKMTCCNNSHPLLAPLCIKCRAIADHDRDGTKMNKELERIIMEDYGGKCYFTKEEMREHIRNK